MRKLGLSWVWTVALAGTGFEVTEAVRKPGVLEGRILWEASKATLGRLAGGLSLGLIGGVIVGVLMGCFLSTYLSILH